MHAITIEEEAMNLHESKEGFMGGPEGQEGEGEML